MFSRFDTMHACDKTDGQTELPWHIRAPAHMLSRVKIRCAYFYGPQCINVTRRSVNIII